MTADVFDANTGRRTVDMWLQGGALAMSEYGASLAKRCGEVHVGITVKNIEAYYQNLRGAHVQLVDTNPATDGQGNAIVGGDGFVFDGTDTSITDLTAPTYGHGRAQAISADLGFLKENGDRFRQGLVIRNFNYPTLRFVRADGTAGRVLTIEPRVDWGMRAELDDHVAISADVHNLNFANNGGPGLHVGLDFRAFGSGHVRLGFNEGAPTLGLGGHIGWLYLDTVVGADPITASVGAHLSF